MRAVGYVRVSTEEQASSGLGLEAQRAAIAAAAARMKLELAKVEADEGISGSIEPRRRPALARALEQLGAGDVLLVAKRDRLSRIGIDIQVLERDLRERDVRILSAAGEGTERDDASAWLMRWILDGFAQYERELTRDRTRKALRAARDRGDRAGSVPFGFRAREDGHLAEHLEELVAIALMRERRELGASLGSIARTLERRGYAPRGKRWYAQSVKTILESVARHS